jgi:GntR family transcriptional regulator
MSFLDLIGRLDGTGPGPRYLRLQALLREAIEAGRIAPGAALPSERELCEGFGLSRVTIRKAMDELVADGLLERRRGAGTFVAARPAGADGGRVEKSFSLLTSFSEDMLARGRQPSSRWLDRAEGTVTPEESLALGLSPGSRVYRFQRLRHADGQTMALEQATIPGWALAGAGVVGDSLYGALLAAGHRPVRALQRVRAVAFDADQAALLEIAAGDPGLLIERRAYAADGRPVEVTRSWYRGDAYDLVAELHHPPA